MVSIEPTRQANGAPLAAETAAASPPSERSGRPRSRIEALVGRPLFWLAIVVVAALLFSIGRVLPGRAPEPALRIPLPAFELTDHRGQRFGLEQLRGRVWIADFIFTTCPTVCPKLTQRMKEIEQRGRDLGDALHLLTITVDPETDTPEVLASYAAAHGLPLDRWTLLTGPLDQIEATVIKGFKIAMGREESSPGLFNIFHGERLVLVDREGVIRGYYEANDEGVSAILRDARVLAKQD